MNRLTALGMVVEALDGKRIAVVVHEPDDLTPTMDMVVTACSGADIASIRRVAGREEIRTHTGGRILFVTPRATGKRLRGMVLDTVYLARYAWCEPNTLVALTATGAEIVTG